MTEKELLYFEDAISHEQSLCAYIEYAISVLEDNKLIEFMKKELYWRILVMNNEEILTNYLSIIKSNVEVYVHGTIESANKQNKDNLKYGLDQTLLSQERTYNEMVNNSWYEVNNVEPSKICDVFKKVSSKF